MEINRINIVLLFVSLLGGGLANAAVPPPVPDLRNANVFSPVEFEFGDDGESVFASQGPACLNYSLQNNFVQLSVPQSEDGNKVTLTKFIREMQQTSGVQLIWSHGDDGILAVESFASRSDANNQLNVYLNSGTLLLGEGQVLQDGAGYWDIWVTASFIARILGGTSKHNAIVFDEACYSDSIASAFWGAGVQEHLGYTNVCPAQTGNANTIFNSMSGVTPIGGV